MRNVEFLSNDDLLSNATFRVKDDTYHTFYKVAVMRYDDPRQIHLRCTCPYNLSEICRHEAATLLQLQDMLDKNILNKGDDTTYNQSHTIAKIKFIDLKMVRMLSGLENYASAEAILRKRKCNILSAANEKVKAELDDNGKLFHLIIEKNEDQYFDTSCTCADPNHVLCKHKTALFLQLLNNYGSGYFNSIKNWDRQKNKLLESYGYTLDDNWQDKFEFIYKEGKPFLRLLDPTVKRLPSVPVTAAEVTVEEESEEVEEEKQEKVRKQEKEAALVLNGNIHTYPYLDFDVVIGTFDHASGTFQGNIEKLDLSKFIFTDNLSEHSKQLIAKTRKLQQHEIHKYLNRNSPFSGIWENIIHQDEELPEETKLLICEYLHPKLKKIFDQEGEIPVFYLPKGKSFVTKNLMEVELSSYSPEISFDLRKDGEKIVMESFIKLENGTFSLSDNQWDCDLMILSDGAVSMWSEPETTLLSAKFRNPLRFSNTEWPGMLQQLVIPLTKSYKVHFEKSLISEVKDGEPGISLQLVEKGEFLLFQPVFTYKGFSVKPDDKETLVIPDGSKVSVIHRRPDLEEAFIKSLENLHSHFIRQPGKGLVLKGSDVLKQNWFFLFIDVMNEKKIPVYGFEALKNFRFNTSRPTTRIQLSSGVDWFDAQVELSFGDQKIGITEIRNALTNKQSFVQLGDGSLGVLPEEWIKKYALLFKMGDGNHDQLRLSKYHLSIIDELYEQRNENEISFDLDEKFNRLREFKEIPEIEAPEGLQLTLRPYQLSGFRWLNYLQNVGWGGILADDMGLGKTAQALSILLHFQNQNKHLRALIVCPTTLIYNWENEIKKFTPQLSFIIHHGTNRARSIDELSAHMITITTYGTLRSDIQMLLKANFDFAILDESQAIKNPFSKVTKAACLLKADHKICMSGTPLQNNTFDLYAQMNFLNPGLLGSVEFFRNEFSTPIDKLGDAEQKEHLRKILYPFILRRTKEQVAKDLPEKTETIIFCEMEDKQRAVYETYRSAFREKILGTIEQQGVGRSQLTILQGLMKLRQICDSPAILNEDEKYPNDSIKLEELSRELTENIGEHKALVFSQFLGMLALIKEQLTKDGIEYEYFDGSTSPSDREKAIQNFQSNDQCRVFLISLKAGGVGLNLTAADYVYIVDPWWNPAVEQQAIDRTHRIGQTKNIFAYRMICKDTIEDKILKLQERKRILAKELIADDQSFVKSLTKEDVEYLFS